MKPEFKPAFPRLSGEIREQKCPEKMAYESVKYLLRPTTKLSIKSRIMCVYFDSNKEGHRTNTVSILVCLLF